MKLHKDGTLEGTPQEIAEYNRLMMPAMIYRASSIKSPSDGSDPFMPDPISRPVSCEDTKNIVQTQIEIQKKKKPWERPVAQFYQSIQRRS